MTPQQLRTRLSELEQHLDDLAAERSRIEMAIHDAERERERVSEELGEVMRKERALNRAVIRRFGFEEKAS
ncbi:MAG TPA: hypothetical protein VFT98_16175 [Myxococcota bacterium]|nr:hypothetical protein [Myxococcota bacterium]